jgi:hypothetical protein
MPTICLPVLLAAAAAALLAAVLAFEASNYIQSRRAFLTIEAIGFHEGLPAPGKRLVMGYRLRNHGRSTAILKDMSINVRTQPKYGLEGPPSYARSALNAAPVPAGATAYHIFEPTVEGKPVGLSDADAEAILQQKVALYIFGLAEYVDAYTLIGVRTTGFCFVYNPRLGPGNFETCVEAEYSFTRRRAGASAPHPLALGIVRRGGEDARGAALADDLDLEAFSCLGRSARHIAQRQGQAHAVAVAARGHPAHDLAGVPDRLVAEGVGILGVHREQA